MSRYTEPSALVRCDACESRVNYFHDGGEYYSEAGEVLYRCERCMPAAIEAAAIAKEIDAQADAYHDMKRDLWISGKPHDHDAVTAALQSAGEMSVGALTRRQAA